MTDAMTQPTFNRRRSDARPQAGSAAALELERTRHPVPVRLSRGFVSVALAVTLSLALVLFFVLCSLAHWGAGEAQS
jgi:hypothetical protein